MLLLTSNRVQINIGEQGLVWFYSDILIYWCYQKTNSTIRNRTWDHIWPFFISIDHSRMPFLRLALEYVGSTYGLSLFNMFALKVHKSRVDFAG